jgi:hypothetical protein
MNPVVLIPSAKRVPVELQAEFGPIPPALIPLGGRPALGYIMDKYPSARFAVALSESGEEVRSYCSRHMGDSDIDLIDVGDTSSVGETVMVALRHLSAIPGSLVINFADTLVDGVQATEDSIYYSIQDDVYRWTTFVVDESGIIGRIVEKGTEKEGAELRVFTGVFCIQEPKAFLATLEEAVREPEDVDPLYSAMRHYFNARTSSVLRAVPLWLDFGHLDTYYKSRQRLSSACREFNSIHVDAERGIITKRSRNQEKLIAEILWYLKLPRQLQYMIPRVFNYSLDYSNPHVQLEYYGYPALNDLYLYGHLDIGAWVLIGQAIERMLDDMGRHRVVPHSSESARATQSSMYLEKTLSRIAGYIDRDAFSWAVQSGLVINGTLVRTLSDVVEDLPGALDEAGLLHESSFCIIHGDLCFSNILYDRRNGIIRLVDPRGRFGEYDLYGDPAYDLCKLSHSIEGDYDLLLNGLYEWRREGQTVMIKAHLSERQQQVKRLFRARFRKRLPDRMYLNVRLLESLLFLSMVPLHDDRPEAQQAFLARGLELYTHTRSQISP